VNTSPAGKYIVKFPKVFGRPANCQQKLKLSSMPGLNLKIGIFRRSDPPDVDWSLPYPRVKSRGMETTE
jgi:hypothetical protein